MKTYLLTLFCLLGLGLGVLNAQDARLYPGTLNQGNGQNHNPFDVKKAYHTKPPLATYPYPRISGQQSQATNRTFLGEPLQWNSRHIQDATLPMVRSMKKDADQPIFLTTQHATPRSADGLEHFTTDKEAIRATQKHLKEVRSLLPLRNPADEVAIRTVKRDELGFTHVRMQQTYKDIPVYGAEAILHFNQGGQRVLNGRILKTPSLQNVTPRLSEEDAISRAKADLKANGTYHELSEEQKAFMQYEGPKVELMIYPDKQQTGKYLLTYQVELYASLDGHWFYILDAKNGKILNSNNHVCHVLPPSSSSGQAMDGRTYNFKTYKSNNSDAYVLVDASKQMHKGTQEDFPRLGRNTGSIITVDLRNEVLNENSSFFYIGSSANQFQAEEISAHVNATICYDYYEQTHNRLSIDGEGGDVISVINVRREEGEDMDNAFWNGVAMFYGRGNQAFTRPVQLSKDIAGHEMTHGVIDATANLVYQDESGALNESFADVFGVLIDREDYKLAEDIANPQVFPSGAMRDMADPHNGGNGFDDHYWQPKHMNEYISTTIDNGGVHINSGIPNHAFYLFAESVGKDKAERVYYRALSQYLIRSSLFIDCRYAVVQSAEDLFGQGSQEARAAANAFDQVGIGSSGGGNEPDPTTPEERNPDFPTNPGTQYVMFSNADYFDDNTLYTYDIRAEDFIPVSTTAHIRPVSVSDDGTIGFMINEDRGISLLDLNLANVQEELVDSDGLTWGNIALSKDGTKFAAVTDQAEGSIFVFDLVTEDIVQFELYSPTTSQGNQNSSTILYADALEWDHTGQYIMYDALNRVGGVEYWDINFLHVYDNERRSFASGNIFPLYNNLDDGISIGNAVFAKNSPYIIAFDMLDNNTGDVHLMTANIETGEAVKVFTNDRLNFPSFATNDRQIVFTAITTSDREVAAIIDLEADKITPVEGSAAGLIGDAKWPVWYATGSRDLTSTGAEEELESVFKFNAYPNPTRHSVNLSYELENPAEVEIELYDLQGKRLRRLSALQQMTPGVHENVLSLHGLSAGLYLVQLRVDEQIQTQKLIIQ